MAIYTINNQPEPIKWETGDFVARTLQNAKNLIMTEEGEIPYDRLRGISHAIFDAPYTVNHADVRREVEKAMLWEPDARVVNVRTRLTGEIDSPLFIEVDLEVNE